MSRRLSVDVAIIGGGLVGSSAALALRGMGFSVALLDKGFCGAQASGVNYGGVRRQGELDDALALGATVAREEQPGPGLAAIRFFADGSSTGGRVVVRRGDAAWRVDVNWLTGAVRVERGEGGR